ncbi:MAG TPA: NAD-binding protein, partial [Nitrospiria bacterium]|nr:NAD-binding protein [Nitrospiria bacterium]
AGYGFNGRNLARILEDSRVPYVIVDIHADLVRKGREEDLPIYFGDVTRVEVLRHLRIHNAKVLVLALSDPFALRRAVQVARQTNPDLHIVVRTRYVRDLEDLTRLGADEVVPEEFESSLEILAIVMGRFQIPPGQIARVKEEIRREGYEKFSREYADPFEAREFLPEEVEVVRHRLHGDSPMIGKSLREMELRTRTGTLVLAAVRNEKTHPTPSGDFVLEKDDLLVLGGRNEQIHEAILLLDAGISPGGDGDPDPSLAP